MIKYKIINWLSRKIPENKWKHFWLFTPMLFIFAFPVSLIVFKLMGYIGWLGVGRALQMTMIGSVLGGVSVGALFLWLIDEVNFDAEYIKRIKWISRLSMVLPVLWILVAFLLAKR